MKELLYKIKNSSFIKNVAIMATGAAGAQAVTMALSPIITRLYGPEAFGILGTFTALIQIIIPISALTYPIAIVLPKSDKAAKGLIKLSLYISFTIAFLTLVILLLFNRSIVNVFNLEEIAPFLYLLPVVIVFAGLMQVSEQWLIRTKQFAVNAKVNFLQSVIINGSKVSIGFIYPAASILVILQVIANGLRAAMMVLFAKKINDKAKIETLEKKKSIKRLAKEYRDFPTFRAPQVFLGAFSESLPILMLTTFFGPASAGFYNIGRIVLSLPSILVGQAIGDVFYPRISEAANKGENINQLIIRASLSLFCIGIVPFGLIILFGPWLFEMVFGSEWGMAGQYARWIALSSFAVFINKPAVRSMPVLEAQGIHLIYTIVFLVTRSSALFIGFFLFSSDIIAVALFSIISALLNVCLFIITIKLGKNMQGS